MPLVTVMMPAHNEQLHISAAIQSILTQSLSDFELLVLDDGSEDRTADIVEAFARRDRRVRLLRRPRQGQVASRNELLDCARTDIVACADADDISAPDRLERQFAYMQVNPEIDVLGTRMIIINHVGNAIGKKRNPLGADQVSRALSTGVSVAQTTFMMRRHLALDVGYRPAYETAEDYDFLLRIKERGRLDNVPAYGVLYRRNPEGVSLTNPLRQLLAADLARATHRLRLAGRIDPTSCYSRPPDLDDPILDILLPDDIQFHRALHKAVLTDAATGDQALRALLEQQGKVSRRRERVMQKALVSLLRRRPFDFLSARAVLFAISLGPRRFLKLLRTQKISVGVT